jgi:heme exporter protein CcmD
MNHWPFIIAAYGLTGLATIAVTLWSYLAMRRAEAELERKDQGK